MKSLGVVSFHGVAGVGIAFISHPSRLARFRGDYSEYELIFDRTTSTLKAEVHSDVKSGKIIAMTWVTYLSSGLVNSTKSTPGQ